MITTRLYGGLGNQMFQYAIARAYNLRTGIPFVVDPLHLPHAGTPRKYELGNFVCDPPKRAVWQRIRRTMIVDERITTPEKFNTLNLDDLELVGYWQNEAYFRDYVEQILGDFTLKEGMGPDCLHTMPPNSVAVHIRLGDYIGNVHHPVQPLEYYEKAFEIIESEIIRPIFYIFSDDPIPDGFMKSPGRIIVPVPPHESTFDLILMKRCWHNIIANSSFSWWGAWLNENPDKIVIAPEHWFNGQEFEGYCPGWRVI
jgi:hypothetical protein